MPTPLQLFFLEEQRRLRLQQLATLIQKIYRGWRCRTHYQQMRKSQILISSWFRGNMVLVAPHSPQRPSPTSAMVQWDVGEVPQEVCYFLQQKKRYGKMKASALLIQAFVRGWKVMMEKGEGLCPK